MIYILLYYKKTTHLSTNIHTLIIWINQQKIYDVCKTKINNIIERNEMDNKTHDT